MNDWSDWKVVGNDNKSHLKGSIPQNEESIGFNPSEWKVAPTLSDEDRRKSENESFIEKIPRNITAGLAQGGHELINTPHDVVKTLEQHGASWIPKLLNLPNNIGLPIIDEKNSLSQYIPHQQEYNFAKLLGQKGEGTPADRAVQNTAHYLPEALMGINALRGALPHLTQRGAAANLQRARQLGIDRGMDALDVNPQLVEDMRQYLPANTLPYRNLMDEAHTGNYQNLFDLQSTAGKHAGALAKTWFDPAKGNFGRAGLDARRDLINDMHRALLDKGQGDVSDLLRQGQEDYRRYMAFKPYRNAILGAIATGTTAAALPKNALTNLASKLVKIGS